jgi:hypothetical protein
LSRTKTEQHLTNNTQKLRDVLGQLKNHYRVDILFEGGTIEKVTVNQQVVDWNQKIENNLDKLLESTKLKYKRSKSGAYLIVEKFPSQSSDTKNNSTKEEFLPKVISSEHPVVLNTNAPMLSPAQLQVVMEQSISGKVTDEKGEPLAGVNIALKGTTRGVNSDGTGRFKINVPNSGAVLVFSFVGFVSKEIAVGSQSIINVILESDNKSLDEVVVVGYGTQKKQI